MKKEQFLGNDLEVTLQKNAPPPQYTAFIIASEPFFFLPSIIDIFQSNLQGLSRPSLNYFLRNLNWV